MTSRPASSGTAPAIAVCEQDITKASGPIGVAAGAGWARVLLRAGRAPLAWVTVGAAEGTVTGEAIARVLVDVAPALARGAVHARQAAAEATREPPVSVVICTRDRPNSLARCLDSIAQIDYPEFEVVIVDNAPSTDAARRLASSHDFRYVEEPIPGLDWARNRGIATATHEIIAFTDDDVRVDRLWLQGIARAFTGDAIGLVTGFVAPGSLDTEAEQQFELFYGGMSKGFAPHTLHPATAEPWRLISTQHLGVGANMAIRRTALAQIDGFDTALDVGTPSHGGGDLDLFHRVLLAGWSAHYEPSAIVWHFHRTTRAGLRRQMYDNGRAFGTYLLVRLRDGRLPRREIAGAMVKWISWLIGRIPRRFLRRERMPLPYIAAELWGAIHAPFAYLATYARDRRLRRRSLLERTQ
ncbi:MAG TPA: glycosyltransferase [Gemmatimonadaceae bacterium]|nr:glycosyltransferase [Gemmatimonadaceae bacterium]